MPAFRNQPVQHRTASAPVRAGAPSAGRRGMTLVEILVVIAIIAILLAAVGLVGSRVGDTRKRKLTRHHMDTLTLAMDAFADAAQAGTLPHRLLNRWPAPPNGFNKTAPNTPPCIAPPPRCAPYEPSQPVGAEPVGDTEDDYYLGGAESYFEVLEPPSATPAASTRDKTVRSIEGFCAFIQLVPESQAVLGRLPENAKRNAVAENPKRDPRPMFRLRPNSQSGGAFNASDLAFVDPIQVLDAWKQPMRYRAYAYRNNQRPFFWSAGPDGKFGADPNRTDSDPQGQDDIFSDKGD